jgi:hypothetical protein
MRHRGEGEPDAGGRGKAKGELGSTDYYGGTGAGGFPPGASNKSDLPIEDPAAKSDKPAGGSAPVQDVPGGTLNDPDNEPEAGEA